MVSRTLVEMALPGLWGLSVTRKRRQDMDLSTDMHTQPKRYGKVIGGRAGPLEEATRRHAAVRSPAREEPERGPFGRGVSAAARLRFLLHAAAAT